MATRKPSLPSSLNNYVVVLGSEEKRTEKEERLEREKRRRERHKERRDEKEVSLSSSPSSYWHLVPVPGSIPPYNEKHNEEWILDYLPFPSSLSFSSFSSSLSLSPSPSPFLRKKISRWTKRHRAVTEKIFPIMFAIGSLLGNIAVYQPETAWLYSGPGFALTVPTNFLFICRLRPFFLTLLRSHSFEFRYISMVNGIIFFLLLSVASPRVDGRFFSYCLTVICIQITISYDAWNKKDRKVAVSSLWVGVFTFSLAGFMMQMELFPAVDYEKTVPIINKRYRLVDILANMVFTVVFFYLKSLWNMFELSRKGKRGERQREEREEEVEEEEGEGEKQAERQESKEKEGDRGKRGRQKKKTSADSASSSLTASSLPSIPSSEDALVAHSPSLFLSASYEPRQSLSLFAPPPGPPSSSLFSPSPLNSCQSAGTLERERRKGRQENHLSPKNEERKLQGEEEEETERRLISTISIRLPLTLVPLDKTLVLSSEDRDGEERDERIRKQRKETPQKQKLERGQGEERKKSTKNWMMEKDYREENIIRKNSTCSYWKVIQLLLSAASFSLSLFLVIFFVLENQGGAASGEDGGEEEERDTSTGGSLLIQLSYIGLSWGLSLIGLLLILPEMTPKLITRSLLSFVTFFLSIQAGFISLLLCFLLSSPGDMRFLCLFPLYLVQVSACLLDALVLLPLNPWLKRVYGGVLWSSIIFYQMYVLFCVHDGGRWKGTREESLPLPGGLILWSRSLKIKETEGEENSQEGEKKRLVLSLYGLIGWRSISVLISSVRVLWRICLFPEQLTFIRTSFTYTVKKKKQQQQNKEGGGGGKRKETMNERRGEKREEREQEKGKKEVGREEEEQDEDEEEERKEVQTNNVEEDPQVTKRQSQIREEEQKISKKTGGRVMPVMAAPRKGLGYNLERE